LLWGKIARHAALGQHDGKVDAADVASALFYLQINNSASLLSLLMHSPEPQAQREPDAHEQAHPDAHAHEHVPLAERWARARGSDPAWGAKTPEELRWKCQG
jgi:hypothetical protein